MKTFTLMANGILCILLLGLLSFGTCQLASGREER